MIMFGRLPIRVLLCAFLCCTTADAQPTLEVFRTRFGVPHITARDYAGLGYGFAYVHATDNLCLMARHLMVVNGEQSKYFSASTDAAANLRADFHARYYYRVDDAVRARFERSSSAAKELVRGYVSGYNSYLANTPVAVRAAECRDAPWIRPMTVDDMYRMFEEKSVLTSGGRLGDALVGAAPPGQAIAFDDSVRAEDEIGYYGSNGWAFGRDATTNQRGLLLGNPHFPWQGDNRFYQVHLTIPGELDVMGVTIAPLPAVTIGFNRNVAWTHTVSSAKRFTLFELKLDATDPLRYVVDGKSLPMTPVTIAVEVKLADGTLESRSHVFYETVFGPLLVMPPAGLVWDKSKAYALGDANRFNVSQIDTWLAIGKARNVAGVKAAAASQVGLPWVNTIAADRHGDALYADISRVPNVSAELLKECQPSAAAAALAPSRDIFVLDGSRSRCNWAARPAVAGKAIMAAAKLPSVVRTDYVANSNDSFWLVHSKLRLAAPSPLNGGVDVMQGLRTRLGLVDIERRLAGSDGYAGNKFSSQTVQQVLFSNRNYAALLVLDEVVKLCKATPSATVSGKTVDLAQACAVLAAWNRQDDLVSGGPALFREFWSRVERLPNLYVVPFDAADPVNTPRQLDIDNATLARALHTALAEAVLLLQDKGFAVDTPLRDMQLVVRNGKKIAIPGGEGGQGVLNVMRSKPLSNAGYEPIHGTSYLQVVTFDEQGPLADAVLAYDQSLDPASPYYSVQSEVFSRSELYRLPFTAEQIRSDPGYRKVELPDDPVLHGKSRGRFR